MASEGLQTYPDFPKPKEWCVLTAPAIIRQDRERVFSSKYANAPGGSLGAIRKFSALFIADQRVHPRDETNPRLSVDFHFRSRSPVISSARRHAGEACGHPMRGDNVLFVHAPDEFHTIPE